MAVLLIDEVRVLGYDEKIDIRIWKVKKDEDYDHGLKYSINYRVWDGMKWVEIFRYDNGHRSGDHRHLFEKVEPVKFTSIGDIYQELIELIERYRGEIDETKIHGNIGNEQ